VQSLAENFRRYPSGLAQTKRRLFRNKKKRPADQSLKTSTVEVALVEISNESLKPFRT
jgi:DNA-binding PucR family transcriptional regulator